MTTDFNRKPPAAKALASRMRATPGKNNDPITSEFDQEIVRKLQGRGILGHVEEMPQPQQDNWEWLDRMTAVREAHEQRQAEAKAEREEAERQEQHPYPRTAAEALRCGLSGAPSPKDLPLNGAGVLRAMLAGVGGHGTINGG